MIDDPGAYDPTEIYETGAEFHLEIFRSARNRQLLKIYEPLRLRFRIAFGLPDLRIGEGTSRNSGSDRRR